jgi:hypothetical protein
MPDALADFVKIADALEVSAIRLKPPRCGVDAEKLQRAAAKELAVKRDKTTKAKSKPKSRKTAASVSHFKCFFELNSMGRTK